MDRTAGVEAVAVVTMPPAPVIGCEWVPPNCVDPCGDVATWSLEMHAFTEPHTDPNATRWYLVCATCALAVLQWVKTESEVNAGTFCHGCDTLLTPTDGAFLISHRQINQKADT
jgi:hypothetical protein